MTDVESGEPDTGANGERRPETVTLRMVAAHAGVSKSVVSRVLQGAPHVSPRRQLAVEKAISELGYRPNQSARSLTQRRSNAVGVLVNDLRQPWIHEFLTGLHPELTRHGFHPLLGDGHLDRGTDQRLLTLFMEMRLGGLILAATMPPSTEIMEAARFLPTVVAGGRDFDLPNVDTIAQDDAHGMALALDYLWGLGHRRIWHLAGGASRVFEERRASYDNWMRRKRAVRQAHAFACDTTEEGGYQVARRMLDVPEQDRPTAIVAVNDYSCVGALAAARDLGIRVPDEMSFIGFDNSTLARMRQVDLTSVDVRPSEVGATTAHHLLERMTAPDLDAREVLVTPELVVRSSTGAAPR